MKKWAIVLLGVYALIAFAPAVLHAWDPDLDDDCPCKTHPVGKAESRNLAEMLSIALGWPILAAFIIAVG